MKKEILLISVVLGLNILQANEIELVGKNVVKNTSEIQKLLIKIKKLESLWAIKNGHVENTKNIEFDNIPKFVKIKAHFLNVRKKPTKKSRIIEVVKKDEVYKIVNNYYEKSQNKYWINIGSGYVNKIFVEEVY